jgi:hypothetical protein
LELFVKAASRAAMGALVEIEVFEELLILFGIRGERSVGSGCGMGFAHTGWPGSFDNGGNSVRGGEKGGNRNPG